MENGLSIHDLNALLNKATAEIQADQKEVAVIEKRLAINIKWKQAIQARIGATQSSGDATDYGRKWDNVRNAIKAIGKTRFTQLDVEYELKKIDPEVQVDGTRLRSTLWSLQNKSELIKQVRKGNNQQAALFEKLSDSKSESEVTNAENGNLTLENHALKQAQVPASGRRPYGSSSETILSVLKNANGKPLKTKQIVALSGSSYGTTYRILRVLETEKKARRDIDKWTLIL